MRPVEIIVIRRRTPKAPERARQVVPAPRPGFVSRGRRSDFARDAARAEFAATRGRR